MGRLIAIITVCFAVSGCEALDRVHAALDVLVGAEPPQAQQPPQQQPYPQPPYPQEQQGQPQQQYASGFYQQGGPPIQQQQFQQRQPLQQQQTQQVQQQQRVQHVDLFDKGLNMVSTTIPVPVGWTVQQDLETDTQTMRMKRFVLDYLGPQGQLIRAVQFDMYGPYLPKRSFGPTWKANVERALGSVENLTLAEPTPSERFAQATTVRETKAITTATVDALEVPFTATNQGQPVEGTVFLMHAKFPQGMGGGVSVTVAVAPKGMGAATAETFLTMDRNQKPNPAYKQRLAQINASVNKRNAEQHQALMRQSQMAHQARMQQNKANFDAHQARMRGQSAAFDQANQAWLDNFRGSGGGGGGGTGYDSQAQFIDTIYERNSFATPEGNVVHNDVYRYNFTDGQGNFFGTDDPNFNPASLQGDWTATQPLQP